VTDGRTSFLSSITVSFTRHHDLLTSFSHRLEYQQEAGRAGGLNASIELHYEWDEVKEVDTQGLLYMATVWQVAVWGGMALAVVQWWRGHTGGMAMEHGMTAQRTKRV